MLGYKNIKSLSIGIENEITTESIHLYLLAFVSDSIDTPALCNKVKGQGSGITITMLTHKCSALRQHPGNQVWFFNNVMQEGILMFEKADNVPSSPLAVPKQQPAAIFGYWERRQTLAMLFLEASDAVMLNGVGQFQAAMLKQAMEHTCLGLIRVFLGYRPNYFGLGFLMDMCSYFMPLPNDIFPLLTPKDKHLFKILAADPTELRRGNQDKISPAEIETLTKRCYRFFQEATTLVQEKGNSIQKPNTL